MKRILMVFAFLIACRTISIAQIREIPAAVKDSFSARYPSAEGVRYNDILTAVHVSFTLDGEKMIAKFNNKGGWKETEKAWSFEKFNPDVQDGLSKSKYAEWTVKEAAIVSMPDGSERYRVKVEKDDITKRYLYFNKNGRLIRDAITL
jgi:hypothetical protein